MRTHSQVRKQAVRTDCLGQPVRPRTPPGGSGSRLVAAFALAVMYSYASAPLRAGQLFDLQGEGVAPSSYYGWSVAIGGNRALVGAPEDDRNDQVFNSGSAYLFDATTGQQLRKLVASNGGAGHQFGAAVALSGNRALIGAVSSKSHLQSSGSAYLFELTSGQQLRELVPADGSVFLGFGRSVGLSDNFAVVGSGRDQVSSTPRAYVFDVASGLQLGTLTAAGLVPEDKFATSIAVHGNLGLVGAWGKDNDAGAAYLFDLPTGQLIHTFTASDAGAYRRFGRSVALSEDFALIGSELGEFSGPGSAYVFDLTTGQQRFQLKADHSDLFGSSVAISGNFALVGAPETSSDGATRVGAAYVFDLTTGQQYAMLAAADGARNHVFGSSVGMSGNLALVGALRANNSGSAYLFDIAIVPEPSTLLLTALALVPITLRRGVTNR